MRGRRVDRRKDWVAALLPLLVILFTVWPNLRGKQGLGSETAFDLSDPLFGNYLSPPARSHDDGSPVQYDWPRDRRLIERIHQGHFDLWNPLPGNGVPIPPDPGGVFSPLRVFLYGAPLPPYAAFVLFRIARLLVAALGAFLLARRYALSRPGSVLVSIAFGLSGGMLSQLPFATPQSVCWVPWVLWAQVRLSQRRTWADVVPVALSMACLIAGGHQPIVVAMVAGTMTHAAGVIAVQRGWSRWGGRRRVAVLVGTGYLLALLLAAPAILATAELVANGHSYKLGDVSKVFRDSAIAINRGALFPGAVTPHTLDDLRTGGAAYPYVLHFSCGVLTYLLAGVAIVWRWWRLEWLLLVLLGIAFCFQPPGCSWMGEAPLLKDILPRYTWALFVLPVCMAGGWGVDALAAARGYRRGPLFVPPDGVTPPMRWTSNATFTTVLAAFGLFALMGTIAVLLMWAKLAPLGTTLQTFMEGSTRGMLLTAGPLVAAAVILAGAAFLLERGLRPASWLLAVVACLELVALARPHLSEPASQQLRRRSDPEVAELADTIAREHGRVGGNAPVTIGLGGWREIRSITPLSPRRYARFIEAAAGPIYWTIFNLPNNRSALTDLAGVSYLIVPRSADTTLEQDPVVPLFRSMKGISVYRNQAALPRARVVHQTIVVDSTNEAVKRLSALTAGLVHVTGTPLASAVLLEPVSHGERPRVLTGGPPTPAHFVVDEPDEVVLAIDSPEAGYLVLADTHYPGWRATVDGKEQPIYPANVGFRAVPVGPGHHTIAFHYRPASFRAGVACSVAGLLACLAILFGARAGRRGRRSGRL